MPYVHCSNCHHEWECSKDCTGKCDWCGSPVGEVLEDKTPLERMLESPILEHLKDLRKIWTARF